MKMFVQFIYGDKIHKLFESSASLPYFLTIPVMSLFESITHLFDLQIEKRKHLSNNGQIVHCNWLDD